MADTFGLIHRIGEEIAADIVLGDDWGGETDIVIDKHNGTVQQKTDGTWVQIYPAIT